MKILVRDGEELNDIKYLDLFQIENQDTLASLLNTAYQDPDNPDTLILLSEFFEVVEEGNGEYTLVCK